MGPFGATELIVVLVIVVVFDAPAHRPRVASVVETYTKRFGQHEVFRVEQPVCAG